MTTAKRKPVEDEAKAWTLGLIMAFAAEVRRDERERALAAIPTRQRVVPSHMLEAFREGYKAGILDKNCAIRALSDAPGGADPTVAPSVLIASGLASWRFVHVGPDHDNALNALDALEAELTALRDNALDLSRVPEGWIISMATSLSGAWSVWLRNPEKPLDDKSSAANGTGLTPRAALDAAIVRANEYGETK